MEGGHVQSLVTRDRMNTLENQAKPPCPEPTEEERETQGVGRGGWLLPVRGRWLGYRA